MLIWNDSHTIEASDTDEPLSPITLDCTMVVLTCPSSNTADVAYGLVSGKCPPCPNEGPRHDWADTFQSPGANIPISPGTHRNVMVTNVGDLWVKGTAGEVVYFEVYRDDVQRGQAAPEALGSGPGFFAPNPGTNPGDNPPAIGQ